MSSPSAAEEYRRLLDECCKVAGPGDWFWNERFVSALERRGLALVTERPVGDDDESYPSGAPYQSPHPYMVGPHAWPIGSLVVWKQRAGDAVGQPLEQQARELLDRAGVSDAQSLTAGSLVEICEVLQDQARWKYVIENAPPLTIAAIAWREKRARTASDPTLAVDLARGARKG